MRRAITLLAFAGALCAAQAARAQTSVAVLGLEPQDGSEGLAKELTDALRQRASAMRGFVLAASKDLVEIKLVFGCVDEAPTCMANAGKTLGAHKLLFGNVRKVGNGFRVTLKWVDVGTGKLENTLSETVTVESLSRENERGMTSRWISQLSGIKIGGAMQIAANLDGASVFVDEKLVGTTGGQPVMVPQIAPGNHQVRIEKSGSKPYIARVKVAPGEVTQVSARLEPEVAENGGGGGGGAQLGGGGGEHNGGGEVEQPGHTSRILFWTTLGAGVASAAAVVGFGLHTKSLEDDKKTAIANSPVTRISMSGPGDNVCDLAHSMGDTRLAGICDDGARSATLTNVFLGVGVASLAASAWFYYKGYVDVSPDHTAAGTRMRVSPYGGTQGGGVLMEWEF
jgi:TolB-like protein